jgi:hypothetical protein
MFKKIFQLFRGDKPPTVIDQREREALIRENAEARGEALGRSSKEEALGDKSIDQVTAPGVVGDPTVLITRKVAEQRARDARPK